MRELPTVSRETGREVLHVSVQVTVPLDRMLAKRVHCVRDEDRCNRQMRKTAGTLFDEIHSECEFYQSAECGVAPLDYQLALLVGVATSAWADQDARLNADLPDVPTREVVAHRCAVHWRSKKTLWKVIAPRAEHYGLRRYGTPVMCVPGLVRRAVKPRGEHSPTLSVGRDGVMVPMRSFREEASMAMPRLFDRGGHRLGMIDLGRIPEAGQRPMTKRLEPLTAVKCENSRGRELGRTGSSDAVGSAPQSVPTPAGW
jgi:hypothetical protein